MYSELPPKCAFQGWTRGPCPLKKGRLASLPSSPLQLLDIKYYYGVFQGAVSKLPCVCNLKLSLTNPHDGYAGPTFPSANHVNFHVDKIVSPGNSYVAVVNFIREGVFVCLG